MSNKRKILVLSNYFLPGYKGGGPIQSISNMIEYIGNMYDFYIITLDRDLGDSAQYPTVVPNTWIKFKNATVLYLPPFKSNLLFYIHFFSTNHFDLIYLQSVFNFSYSIIPLLALLFTYNKTPILICPRGELAEGALSLHSFKKKLYLFWFNSFYRNLLNIYFHSSTQDENECIHRVNKYASTFIALNFTSSSHLNPSDLKYPRSKEFRCVFYSRISPKKNLDYAISIIQKLKGKVSFDFYGSISDPVYYKYCLSLIHPSSTSCNINYCGEIIHDNFLTILSKYDLFFFPTKNENFGHVIHEALRSGVPVLTSDQTPWHELEFRNAGWEVPLNQPNLFVEKIEHFIMMTYEQRLQMRHAALQYGIDAGNNQKTIQDNVQMFNTLLSI